MLSTLERALFGALSPAGRRGRLSVLIFHRVLALPDPLLPGEPDATRFTAQMQWLKSAFNVLPLTEAVERLRSGSLPSRAAAITFDDGYADNFTVALPILKKLGLPATFFIATGYLDGGRMWNDSIRAIVQSAEGDPLDLAQFGFGQVAVGTTEEKRTAVNLLLHKLKYLLPSERECVVAEMVSAAGLPARDSLMMTSQQVSAMSAAGMTIGAHTVMHPILARLDEESARREMADSRDQLEALTGSRVELFAYPNGKPGVDYTPVHARIARDLGFAAACSTEWGISTAASDLFQIPRFTPWDRSRWRYALRLARNLRLDAAGA